MKIVFTGGGTGGHFYPLMAVADAILEESRKQTLIAPRLYYTGPEEYNPKELFDRGIQFVRIGAGKKRIGATGFAVFQNFIDIFRMGFGCLFAIIKMFFIYPDIIFAKGGYASFPTLFAAKILFIPVIIHESDSVPGRVSVWASKFAKKIAISYKESAEYFDPKKVAYTGQPIRKDIIKPIKVGSYEYLEADTRLPIITILGGSQGSKKINDLILLVVSELTKKYTIIHQTGKNNLKLVQGMSKLALDGATHPERYKPMGYMSPMTMSMIAGVSTIIISRAGSGIFEIASWNIPSILIPITESNGDHQRKNAYNYARTGSAIVIEENNLSPQILIHEIEKIIGNRELHKKMSENTKNFFRNDASEIIAKEIINMALEHEV